MGPSDSAKVSEFWNDPELPFDLFFGETDEVASVEQMDAAKITKGEHAARSVARNHDRQETFVGHKGSQDVPGGVVDPGSGMGMNLADYMDLMTIDEVNYLSIRKRGSTIRSAGCFGFGYDACGNDQMLVSGQPCPVHDSFVLRSWSVETS